MRICKVRVKSKIAKTRIGGYEIASLDDCIRISECRADMRPMSNVVLLPLDKTELLDVALEILGAAFGPLTAAASLAPLRLSLNQEN